MLIRRASLGSGGCPAVPSREQRILPARATHSPAAGRVDLVSLAGTLGTLASDLSLSLEERAWSRGASAAPSLPKTCSGSPVWCSARPAPLRALGAQDSSSREAPTLREDY